MTTLELHMNDHSDALGAALLVGLVAVIAVVCIVIHYDRLRIRERQRHLDRLIAARAEYQKRLSALVPSRRLTLEEAAAQAERITRHDVRTILQEASGDLTMDGLRLAERPVWTSGGAL
jgi:hypothetical protein